MIFISFFFDNSTYQKDYGDNYSERNLRHYRQFYQYFSDLQIWYSRVPNLSWTHFRHLLRVDDEKARLWYMREAATQLWSTRELEQKQSNYAL